MTCQLMVSYDHGRHCGPDRSAETIDELEERMEELDRDGLRWCLEKTAYRT